jgi:hypothetical protein
MEAPSLTAVQKQILKFFKENSHAIETARGIMTWLGAVDPKEVQQALDDLAGRKLLLCHESGAVLGYALNPDERVFGQIKDPI